MQGSPKICAVRAGDLTAIRDWPESGSRPRLEVKLEDSPEREFFTRLINNRLGGDESLKGVLPLREYTTDLMEASREGVLCWSVPVFTWIDCSGWVWDDSAPG